LNDLKTTSLTALHRVMGARMVAFAGWDMPLQFAGVIAEHEQTRASASLFDVSHMGQVVIEGADAAAALERMVPQAVTTLAEGRQRYAFLTNATGGIVDDLMIAVHPGQLFLVVNAARTDVDLALLRDGLPGCTVTHVTDRALLALQGPLAARALGALVPEAAGLRFMDARQVDGRFGRLWISRSGYTGEDGFEISVMADAARPMAEELLARGEVAPAGLGARDTLRLEAGLCLYGQDIDETTSPVEAGLAWAIQKRRREEGGFPGADRIRAELRDGPARIRVGLRPEGRAPMRAGTPLFADPDSAAIGQVTSGAFAPTLGAPVAMGYVPPALSDPGTPLWGEVRGKRLPAEVVPLPFHRPEGRS